MPPRPPPQQTAAALIPERPTLSSLRAIAAGCQACDLYRHATQTVFGEGERGAALMLVGEQPSDREDLAGRPFVGPAGKLLDRALEEVGIDRGEVYVTNVVKHFKWEQQGKRRIHAKPNAKQIGACRPWLDAEIRLVQPRILVCLGATAAQALLGRQFRVTQQHGQVLRSGLAPYVMATVHPSSILRAPNEATRREELAEFIEDLRGAARLLQTGASEPSPAL